MKSIDYSTNIKRTLVETHRLELSNNIFFFKQKVKFLLKNKMTT